MNNKIKFLAIALVAVLALAALGAGVAFAQSRFPNTVFGWMMGNKSQNGTGYNMMGGNGSMMGGYAQSGNSWEWMDAMHDWMTASGGMHTFIWNALADKLGLTSDQLTAEVNSGKTISQIAAEKGISRADLVTALETAHKDSLAKAVTDGVITQVQADSILAQMSGRYDWMLDNMGNGGMMGGQYGPSGMMNGQYGPGGMMGGQYGPGGLMNRQGGAANQPPQP